MLVVLLALSRYIVNGEPVDVRSDAADLVDDITLSDGMEIMQPLTIPEGSSWRQGYYALFVSESSPDSAGKQLIESFFRGNDGRNLGQTAKTSA